MVMMNLRISSWLGASRWAVGLSGVFSRVKNAAFLVRGFWVDSRRGKLIAENTMTWDSRGAEQGIRPVKQAVIIT